MSSFIAKNTIPYSDELVREYLFFRGFTKTLAILEQERKTDKLRGFNVEKIVEHLLSCVSSHQLDSLIQTWNYLDSRFFSGIDPVLFSTVRKLDLSLKRYYLVHAVSSQNIDKVKEFFEQYGDALSGDPDWKSWFGTKLFIFFLQAHWSFLPALAYMKNPEQDEEFSLFFTKEWSETFSQTLHNFLCIVFQNIHIHYAFSFSRFILLHQWSHPFLKSSITMLLD